ncbi:isomerase [Bhargavaea cecembensis]|uniref:Isomerase n=1 Tax=Bhargavaea cecembensis TaxID=394098 RepID=A0A165HGN2_9BACL|nr:PhzF family phenazine biosynthesis protein [Bhargavaea cecembensis]KZE39884.1 isomerase [Bhargavaea cecembensis]
MGTVTVYQYDAFSTEPDKGNPAGVVLRSEGLTDSDMQEITARAGYNETAFLLDSDQADLRIRYFTPGYETDLCGHATMAMIFALASRGELDGKEQLTIETKAGILPLRISRNHDGEWAITMKQAAPKFIEFGGSKEVLMHSIGLKESDLHPTLPILYGSTGSWTLLVPVKHLSVFKEMKPDNQRFPEVLQEVPRSSIHPFCLETYDPAADMHGRHFSSPFAGTIEDAVTGTASAVMGAYYAKYITSGSSDLDLLVEQGQEIGKDGRVAVHISNSQETMDVQITGKAVYVKELQISLP